MEDNLKDKDGGAVKEDNIIKGKQLKRLPKRYTAHLTHLKEKIYRDKLLPPPKNWKELIRH